MHRSAFELAPCCIHNLNGENNMKLFGKLMLVLMVSIIAIPVLGQGIGRRRVRIRQTRVEKAFNRMDRNKDGRITREEWQRKPKAFDRLDTNRDGAITIDELRNARRR